jgi:hypothetical protein
VKINDALRAARRVRILCGTAFVAHAAAANVGFATGTLEPSASKLTLQGLGRYFVDGFALALGLLLDPLIEVARKSEPEALEMVTIWFVAMTVCSRTPESIARIAPCHARLPRDRSPTGCPQWPAGKMRDS